MNVINTYCKSRDMALCQRCSALRSGSAGGPELELESFRFG